MIEKSLLLCLFPSTYHPSITSIGGCRLKFIYVWLQFIKKTEEVRQQVWEEDRTAGGQTERTRSNCGISKFWSCSTTKQRQTGPKRTGPKLPEPRQHHRRLKAGGGNEPLINPPRLTWLSPAGSESSCLTLSLIRQQTCHCDRRRGGWLLTLRCVSPRCGVSAQLTAFPSRQWFQMMHVNV